jgi:hypothetical protein
LQKLGHQSSPAGLVTCAESFAAVAMKVFVELNQILPVGIRMEPFEFTIHRAPTLLVAQKNASQPS